MTRSKSWGWDLYNSKNAGIKIKRNWKSVSEGETHSSLTVLTSGSGVELVEARCSCGRVDRYMASRIKSGKVRKCAKCDEFQWKPPEKWRNPKPKSKQDIEIELARNEKSRKKRLASQKPKAD